LHRVILRALSPLPVDFISSSLSLCLSFLSSVFKTLSLVCLSFKLWPQLFVFYSYVIYAYVRSAFRIVVVVFSYFLLLLLSFIFPSSFM
jgi:hypothetical protein